MDSQIAKWRDMLSKYAKIKDEETYEIFAVKQKVIARFKPICEEWNAAQKMNSPLFNPFHVIGINEVRHSRILGFLLNPYETHGQKDEYLKIFLNRLGIQAPGKGFWQVGVETEGRVDTLLKYSNSDAVIIIENKSNWAVDQFGQLYRYYEQHIKPHRKNVSSPGKDPRFRILYLVPHASKELSDYSLMNPNGSTGAHAERVPDELLSCWVFDKEVIQWLAECLDATPTSNIAMQQFIKQYISFWKY